MNTTLNKKKVIINNDLLYSNWSLVLYVLYMLNIIKYSPLLLLISAFIIATITMLCGVYTKKISYNNFMSYIIMSIFLKLIPIYTIRNDKITTKVIIYSLCVIIIYLLYLDINSTSFLSVYSSMANNNPTYLGIYYKNICSYISNIFT